MRTRLFIAFILYAAPVVSYPLREVARLPAASSTLGFGDTDHDGRNEVISRWRDQDFVWFYRIHELVGKYEYVEVYRGTGISLHIHAVGDLDQDGRSDIVGQVGGTLQVFESISPHHHPTELVWTYPSSNILGTVAIADTDRDGKLEIIDFQGSGASSAQIRIFEAVGDNDYALVWSFATHQTQRPIVGDFDGDGLIEIAYCGRRANVGAIMSVIESPADNTWVLTFEDSTGMGSSGKASGGEDTDGNGRIELFFSGLLSGRATVVYEPIADNTFERVATLWFDDNSSGTAYGIFGNLDGQGVGEFLHEGNTTIRIHRPIAVGAWTEVGRLTDPNGVGLHSNAYLFDTNQNGLPELYWPCNASDAESTLVYEYDPTTTSVPDEPMLEFDTARFIVPSPARTVVRMHAPGFADRIAAIAVYDVAGRLVERFVPVRDSRDALLWTPRRVVTGVYFLRPESPGRQPLATRRVVLIR